MRILIIASLFAAVLVQSAALALGKDNDGVSNRDRDQAIQVVDLTRDDRARICNKTVNADTFARLGCWKLTSFSNKEESVALSTGDIIKICENTKNSDTFSRLGCGRFVENQSARGVARTADASQANR